MFLLTKKTCPLDQPEDMSFLVFFCSKETFLLLGQEDMSSRLPGRRFFLLNNKTCLLAEHEDVLRVPQEGMPGPALGYVLSGFIKFSGTFS